MKFHLTEYEIQSYLTNELSLTARKRIASHLEICQECSNHFMAYSEIFHALRDDSEMKLPETFTSRVMAAVDEISADNPGWSIWQIVGVILGIAGAFALSIYYTGTEIYQHIWKNLIIPDSSWLVDYAEKFHGEILLIVFLILISARLFDKICFSQLINKIRY